MASSTNVDQYNERLRAAAEARLLSDQKAKEGVASESINRPTDELVHDLRVQQIELQMQNEALRQAQSALAESRDRYVDLFEFAPVAYLTLTSDGMIAETNLTGVRLLGRERKNLLNRRFDAFIVAEDQDRWHLHFLRVKTRNEDGKTDLWLKRDDGTTVFAHIECTRSNSATGSCLGDSKVPIVPDPPEAGGVHRASLDSGECVRIALSEITDRKLAENELHDSEEKYRRLVDDMPAFIATFLPDGTLTYTNEALTTLVGQPRAQLVGRNFYEFLSENDQDMVRARLASLTPEDPVETHEQRYRSAENVETYHQWTNRAFFGPSGTVVNLQAVGTDITARKQIEKALRHEERYQRALIDNFPFAVWLKDNQSRYLAINRGFALRFGSDNPDTLIGKTDHDLVPPDLAEAYQADDRAIVDARQNKNAEEEVTTDGVQKWFETYKAPVIDDDGTVLGTVGFSRDISARKQIEAALQESEQRFRSVMEDIPNIAVQGYALDGTVTFWNPASERLYGYSADETLGANLLDLIIPPEMKDDVKAAIAQMARTGKPIPASELLLKHKDGSRVPVLSSHAFISPMGRSPELFCLDTDLTDRRAAESALREEREFFHLIAENIGDFIAVLDLEGRRLYNSPSYERFFGDPGDLLGTDSFADVHPDDRERVIRVFRDTVTSGLGRQLEYRLVMKDGSTRDMESRGSAIKDSEGRVVRVVIVSHDVTERKQMEMQVRQMAFHDMLTNLPNRRLLNDRLSLSMAANARSGRHGALMFLDLDNFKPLNDHHGHDAGDALLIEVAERLKRCIREMDTVARFGGDEFAVMISELEVDRAESFVQAGIIAEKIRTAVADPCYLTITREGRANKGITYQCTASIGVALFAGHEASTEGIIKWADTAMYRAKAAGRNLIRFYDSKPD